MKVVCCKNCGAKYQLDDEDDITTFECSSCAGELEYLEEYSDGTDKSRSSFMDSFRYDNSYIPHGHLICEECGKVTDFDLCNFDKQLSDAIGSDFSSYELKVRYVCDECKAQTEIAKAAGV